jgi:hypothetical protein
LEYDTMRRLRTAAGAFPTPTVATTSASFDERFPEWGGFVGEPWGSGAGSDPQAVSRSRLADAVTALQGDARSLDTSLRAFADPLTVGDVERVKAYIGAVQDAVDRLCQVIAPAAGPVRV